METTKRPLDELGHQIEAMKKELASLHDDARVQRHLLSMEVRERFDALDKRRLQLQDNAGRATEHTLASLRQSITELRASFKELAKHAQKKPEAPAAKG